MLQSAMFQTGISWQFAPWTIALWIPLAGMLLGWLNMLHKERLRRMDLIEKAMQRGEFGRDVQRELVLALRPQWLHRTMIAIGWFGMLGGVVWWVMAYNTRMSVERPVLVTVAGFALLALPLVWREVEGRGQGA